MKLKVFCQWLRIALFSIALLSFCVLGFLTFLRPEISDKEGIARLFCFALTHHIIYLTSIRSI